jgi:hypothetical protein
VQYLFHKEAGASSLILKGDEHRYIFKVRRHREGETIALRNLEDDSIRNFKNCCEEKTTYCLVCYRPQE